MGNLAASLLGTQLVSGRPPVATCKHGTKIIWPPWNSVSLGTRVMADCEIWEPLQCKTVFNTYLSVGRSNQKGEESGLAFLWPNWSSSDLPNPNTNTQIRKHTNTQIQHITKCQKDPPCGIFLKRGLFKDVKNDVPMCKKRKYKNTNTQIHKHTNTQIQHITK